MNVSRLKIIVIGAAIGALLLTGIALAAGENQSRHVVSGGGDTITASGITLRNTIAQPIAGSVSNGTSLCNGFVCGQSVAASTPAPSPTPTTSEPTATPTTEPTVAPTPTPTGDYFIYLPLVLK